MDCEGFWEEFWDCMHEYEDVLGQAFVQMISSNGVLDYRYRDWEYPEVLGLHKIVKEVQKDGFKVIATFKNKKLRIYNKQQIEWFFKRHLNYKDLRFMSIKQAFADDEELEEDAIPIVKGITYEFHFGKGISINTLNNKVELNDEKARSMGLVYVFRKAMANYNEPIPPLKKDKDIIFFLDLLKKNNIDFVYSKRIIRWYKGATQYAYFYIKEEDVERFLAIKMPLKIKKQAKEFIEDQLYEEDEF